MKICKTIRRMCMDSRTGVTTTLVTLMLIAGAMISSGPCLAQSAGTGWTSARPSYQWSFPQDHWSHSGYKTEWWYFTGHLQSNEDPSRSFGYQFTFFRVGLLPERLNLKSAWAANNLVMGHASISDLSRNRHVFSEVLYRETPFMGGFGVHPDPLIAWCTAPPGTDGRWTLNRTGEGFDISMRDDRKEVAFTLSTRPLKPFVFQGPNGFSRKGTGPGAASQYYSFTRLETNGSLSVGDETFTVRGLSWMDREFGSNQLTGNQAGWDWFSLQLDDGRDIMIYVLRDRSGAMDFGRGTIVSPEGSAQYLDPSQWQLTKTGTWKSPETEAEYPAGWRIVIADEDLDLEIVPLLNDQENVSRQSGGLYYWEGAVAVRESGTINGRGYVELTGYGRDNRPPI